MDLRFDESDLLGCCGRTRFVDDMALASPFSSSLDAISAARDIWFNKVDVNGWFQAFRLTFRSENTVLPLQPLKPELSGVKSLNNQLLWLLELNEWNALYRENFGFMFMIVQLGEVLMRFLLN